MRCAGLRQAQKRLLSQRCAYLIEHNDSLRLSSTYWVIDFHEPAEAFAPDARELLKVNYNAGMRTRDVPGLVRRVETTVRGHGGRIDQESSSPQSGYVSFVVPMSKYDAFRTELESLVYSKSLIVNIQSSNMLPQKQSIEEQQKQADKTIADYQTARQKMVVSRSNG